MVDIPNLSTIRNARSKDYNNHDGYDIVTQQGELDGLLQAMQKGVGYQQNLLGKRDNPTGDVLPTQTNTQGYNIHNLLSGKPLTDITPQNITQQDFLAGMKTPPRDIEPYITAMRDYLGYIFPGAEGKLDEFRTTPVRLVEGVDKLLNWATGKDFIDSEGAAVIWDHLIGEGLYDDKEPLQFRDGTVIGNPSTMAQKLGYMTGYFVPDMFGAHKTVELVTDIIQPITKLGTMISRLIGLGTYGGLSHGVQGARDFVAMDLISAPFMRYSRPARALIVGGLMAGYTEATQDKSPGVYDPQAKWMAGIMGGVFNMMGPAGKANISKDIKGFAGAIKNWSIKELKYGREPELKGYIADLLKVRDDVVRKSVIYEHEEINFDTTLQNFVMQATGRPTKAVGKELEDKLTEIILNGPGGESLTPELASTFVKKLMGLKEPIDSLQLAGQDGLEYVRKPIDPNEAKVPIEMGESVIYVPESRVDNYTYVIEKTRMLENEAEKIYAKHHKSFTSTLHATGTKFLDTTIRPEGPWMAEVAKKYPAQYKRIADEHTIMNYAHTGMADHFINKAEREIGYLKMDDQMQRLFRQTVSSKANVDKFQRKSKDFMQKSLLSEGEHMDRIDLNRDIVSQKYGPDELSKFEDSVRAYYEAASLTLWRKRLNKVISQETYDKTRLIDYLSTESVEKQADDLVRFYEGAYGRGSVEADRAVKYLKKPEGVIETEDVMYQLHRLINITESQIAKSNFLASIHALAKEEPTNVYFREPIFEYKTFNMREGRLQEEAISKAEHDAYAKRNDAIKKALTARRKAMAAKKRAAQEAALADVPPTAKVKIVDETPQGLKKALQGYNLKKAQLQKEYNKLLNGTERLQVKLRKTQDEIIAETDARPIERSFDRSDPNISQLKYDIEDLTNRIQVEKDIQFALQTELKGQRIWKSPEPIEMPGYKAIRYERESGYKWVMVDNDIAKMMYIRGEGGVQFRERIRTTTARWATWVPLTKGLSVAYNPTFGPRSLFRDIDLFGMNDPAVSDLYVYRVKTASNMPKIIDAIRNKESLYTRAREAGLNADRTGTLTGLAVDSVHGRRLYSKPDSWMAKDSKLKTTYFGAVKVLSYLGELSEAAVRLNHFDYLTTLRSKEGLRLFTDVEAAQRVNRVLNYSRKGPVLESLDDFYAFAGASAQVLDSYWRGAVGGDPLLNMTRGDTFLRFSKKMMEYALSRAAIIAIGYAIAPEQMANYPVSFKISNYIIPLPFLVDTDEYGQDNMAALRWSNDRNPFISGIDLLLYKSFDIMHGYDTPERTEQYFKEWQHTVSPLDVGSLTPSAKFLLAAFYNKDPNNFRDIFADHAYVVPKERGREEANMAAVTLSDLLNQLPILPDSSPIGVARAARGVGAQNSLLPGFIGTLLSTHDFKPNRATSRKVYELLKSVINPFVYWSNFDGSSLLLDEFIQRESSPIMININQRVDKLMESVIEGNITEQQALKDLQDLKKRDGINDYDEATATTTFVHKLRGWQQWKFFKDKYPDVIRKLPSHSDMQKVAGAPPKVRAKWYLRESARMSKEELKIFDQLAKTYGLTSEAAQGQLEQLRAKEKK